MAARITMGDVAEQAGVSRSTLSRVLAGEDVVAEETAERVSQTAMKLGYQLPARKRNGSSPVFVPRHIVIIARQPLLGGLAALGNAFYASLASQGFQTKLIMQDELTTDRLVDVRGAILVRTSLDDQLLACLHDTPWIQALGQPSVSGPLADVVSYDNAMVGAIAADWLCKQGCRHLAAVVPTNPVAEVRAAAFQARARDAEAAVTIIDCDSTAVDDVQAATAVTRLQGMAPAADGLFAFNDHTLLCLYPHLLRAGIDLQGDLKLIGCDAEPYLGALTPRPATIDVHMAQLAKRAVETLIWRLDNPDDRPVAIMLRPELVEPQRLASLVDQQLSASLL